MTRGSVTKVGIDAPFGWPNEFIEALNANRAAGGWGDWPTEFLRLRETDRAVRAATKLTPLSVSTDKIGVVALRCAKLLAHHWGASGEPPDRTGSGRIVEVYPAAALRQWGLSPKDAAEDPGSYKGAGPLPRARRRRLMTQLAERSADWLELTEKTVAVCTESDDCLDALMCALIARGRDGTRAADHRSSPSRRRRLDRAANSGVHPRPQQRRVGDLNRSPGHRRRQGARQRLRQTVLPTQPPRPVSGTASGSDGERQPDQECRVGERLSHKATGSSGSCTFATRSPFATGSSWSRRSRSGRLGRSQKVGENGSCRIRTTALVCATASRQSSSLVRRLRACLSIILDSSGCCKLATPRQEVQSLSCR